MRALGADGDGWNIEMMIYSTERICDVLLFFQNAQVYTTVV